MFIVSSWPVLLAVLSSVLRLQKREIALEILNYRKNGEKFWNLLSLMPVKDACGNVVSFIGVQSDITELIRRKHAERELQQAKVGNLSRHPSQSPHRLPACSSRTQTGHVSLWYKHSAPLEGQRQCSLSSCYYLFSTLA